MIRLATVFSGIGAIEHALNRMEASHSLVFACDNGEVDILTKKINVNIDEIGDELTALKESIEQIRFNDEIQGLYKEQLNDMLTEAGNEYRECLETLNHIPASEVSVRSLLSIIIDMPDVKAPRKKEYKSFFAELGIGTCPQIKLKELQTILAVYSDFTKDNAASLLLTNGEFASTDGILWDAVRLPLSELHEHLERYRGKRIIRTVQDLSQRASQLHEKINYLKVQKKLETMGEDWTARKAYVDSLYAGLESRNKVRQSYLANYALDEKDFHWNVAFMDGRQYRDQVDLFVGGSPCQSFSLVGKQRGLEDTRGTLFYEFARLIREVNPKVFIYENVRAVLSNDNGKTWAKMQEVFGQLGYRFSSAVLNAKDYGIPQNRERLFVVGFRNDLTLKKSFEFPGPIPLEKKMQAFLLDNAPGGYFLPKKGVEFVTREKNIEKRFTQIDGEIQLCQKKNQQFNWHGDFIFQSEEDAVANNIPELEKYFLSEKVKRYVLSSGTKNFYSRPEIDLEVARPLLTTMHKMHRAGVDNYVTTQGRIRKLTPRECLRLMGFSDEFRIVVSDTSMYQQAGNSIVVDVLISILKKIQESYCFQEV